MFSASDSSLIRGWALHYLNLNKRAGLARAMALDPEVLFFDEPSAGRDPVSAKRLDDLILQLRDSWGPRWWQIF